jgi:hypothetical protein
MDLNYMQKYSFSTIGGSGGIPLVDNATFITSLIGGSLFSELVIPGGLVYKPCDESFITEEIDPWLVEVKEDFDSLLDLVSLSTKKNKTMKKRIQVKNRKTK